MSSSSKLPQLVFFTPYPDGKPKAHVAAHQPPLASSPGNAEPDQRRLCPAEMCGSLHLTDSPGGSDSDRPEHWRWTGADPLFYGHHHGFGDTAEDLSDSGCRRPAPCTSERLVDGPAFLLGTSDSTDQNLPT